MSWSRVQSAANTSSGTTCAVTPGSNLTAGTKLIALVAIAGTGSNGAPSVSVSDGNGSNLTQLVAVGPVGTVKDYFYLYALDTPSGDAGTKPTITAAGGFSNGMALLVQEVSGLLAGNTTAMADGTAGTASGYPGNNFTPTLPSYASSASGEYLLYAYLDDGDGGSTWTAPSGYTADANAANGSSTSTAVISYKNSTGGTETGTYSQSSGSGVGWATILVAFKLAPPPYFVTTTSLPAAEAGVAYSQTLGVSGGTGPYTWSVLSGSLPSWASLSSSGVISGTPSSLTGPASFTVEVTDSTSATATQALTLDMNPGGALGTSAVPGFAQPGNAVPGQMSGAGTVSGGAALTGSGTLSSAAVLGYQAPLSGHGTLSSPETLGYTAPMAGSGTLSAAGTAVVPGAAAMAGSGVLSSAETLGFTAPLTGQGALGTAETLGYTASLTGHGTLSAAETLGYQAPLTGTGALSSAETLGYTAPLTGSGVLGTAETLGYTAPMAGAGALSSAEALGYTASLAGTGTLSAAETLGYTAPMSGSGTLAAAGVAGQSAFMAGAGTLSSAETLGFTASLAGSGTLSAAETLGYQASLAGSGALSSAETLGFTAPMAGSGQLGASPELGYTAPLSGHGTLSSPETLGYTAALAGSGTLTAAWQFSAAAALLGRGTLAVSPLVTHYLSDTDSATGTDAGENAGGSVVKTDSDSAHGQDSEFSFLTDSDTGGLSAETALLSPGDGDFTGGTAEGESVSGPSIGPYFRSDGDASGLTAEGQVVDVWTYQPPFRWTGGNYEVVHRGRTVWRGPQPDRYALALSAGLASGALDAVFDGDSARAEDGESPVITVTLVAERAVTVTLEASAVPVSSRQGV